MKNNSPTMILMAAVLLTGITLPACNRSQDDRSKANANIETTPADSIVRAGVIDLKKIDADNDGIIYQCPMHANVLADKEEKCPLCKMKLTEMTLAKAKDDLVKNGFQVK